LKEDWKQLCPNMETCSALGSVNSCVCVYESVQFLAPSFAGCVAWEFADPANTMRADGTGAVAEDEGAADGTPAASTARVVKG
jgi:hypothetical protein